MCMEMHTNKKDGRKIPQPLIRKAKSRRMCHYFSDKQASILCIFFGRRTMNKLNMQQMSISKLRKCGFMAYGGLLEGLKGTTRC